MLKNHGRYKANSFSERTPLNTGFWRYVDIVELLQYEANINTRNCHGFTPLNTAVTKGHAKLVNILLQNRADVNTMDNLCDRHIDSSAIAGSVEVMILLENGAD